MTPDQLTRAASQVEAALARLDIQPVEITDAELEADDAAFPPALVDGKNPREKSESPAPPAKTPTLPAHSICASGAKNPTATADPICANGANNPTKPPTR